MKVEKGSVGIGNKNLFFVFNVKCKLIDDNSILLITKSSHDKYVDNIETYVDPSEICSINEKQASPSTITTDLKNCLETLQEMYDES